MPKCCAFVQGAEKHHEAIEVISKKSTQIFIGHKNII
jgi:hypothetical protein